MYQYLILKGDEEVAKTTGKNAFEAFMLARKAGGGYVGDAPIDKLSADDVRSVKRVLVGRLQGFPFALLLTDEVQDGVKIKRKQYTLIRGWLLMPCTTLPANGFFIDGELEQVMVNGHSQGRVREVEEVQLEEGAE